MAKPKKRFTPEFRAEAVRLAQTSGRSRRAVAENLGIGLSTLRNWIDGRRDREMDAPPPDSSSIVSRSAMVGEHAQGDLSEVSRTPICQRRRTGYRPCTCKL